MQFLVLIRIIRLCNMHEAKDFVCHSPKGAMAHNSTNVVLEVREEKDTYSSTKARNKEGEFLFLLPLYS